MKIQKCPKCNGKGFIYDHLFGVFTLGIGYLVQSSEPIHPVDKCKSCKGKGYIK